MKIFLLKICFQAGNGRTRLAALVAEKQASSSTELMAIVVQHGHKLKNSDRMFGVELGVMSSLCGPASEARVSAMIMGILPDAERHTTVEKSIELLAAMCAQESFKFVPVALQSCMTHILGMLRTVEAGQSSTLKITNKAQLVMDAWAKFVYFPVMRAGRENQVHVKVICCF